LTRRRQALSGAALALLCSGSANAETVVAAQPRVTGRVFLDFAQEAADGGTPVTLGRVVVGLYGDVVPLSCALFARLAAERGWVDAYVSELRPGEYITTTAQGSPPGVSNPEAVLASAFQLPHSRPGTVSLSASGRPTFRITTGPGPVPLLDGLDIVLGRVLEGTDVIVALSRQSTFAPREGSVTRTYNSLAGALGDGRAATARASWVKPQRRLFIADAGVLPNP
jgi:peptidyl-prolyl cis-trans isomerase B (cyclophilin B)